MGKPSQRQQKKKQFRRLLCETLESRQLLAVDLGFDTAALDALTFLSSETSATAHGEAGEVALAPAPGSLAAFLASQAVDPDLLEEVATVIAGSTTPPPARHNWMNPADVDASGAVDPADALLVINHLHGGDPSVPNPGDLSNPGVFYTDVNNDGTITSADADQVLRRLDQLTGPAESEGEEEFTTFAAPPPAIPDGDDELGFITPEEVENLLARAAGATASEDAVIAIVDRGGRILGVRMEQGVLDNIPDLATRVFAIDGAVAKARTAAFFANGQAPLTSRTIRSLSQTTIIEREVESNPTVPIGQNPFNPANPIARTYGPGVVAAIGVGGHFPPDIRNTPPVDLFNIELQSRDGLTRPGADGIKGTGDDFTLQNRFNVPTQFLRTINGASYDVPAPESYGVQSGSLPNAIGRGIATMPGGIPLFKLVENLSVPSRFTLVGGIGVFFPGLDGYATHEQGFVPNAKQTSTQRLNSAKALEAEYMAVAAVNVVTDGVKIVRQVGPIGGIDPVPGYLMPFGRIDLVGIQLEVLGPNPTAGNRKQGFETVFDRGRALGQGDTDNGLNFPVNPGGDTAIEGQVVPDGWLIMPHASPVDNISAADVNQIVNNAIAEANLTRAAIRLKVDPLPPVPGAVKTKMVIAVSDTAGNILGLFRMNDATIFSIDVAVAKARNTAYYADPADLQNADKVDDDLLIAKGAVTTQQLNKLNYKNNNGVVGTPDLFTNNKSNNRYSPLTGLAFTNRTFRFLAEPRYPSGVDGSLPPEFSILTDPGTNRKTAENFSQAFPTPASQFTSVMGFDAFNPSRNFHDPGDVITPALGVVTNPLANQNGIVFFPGSTPLYKSTLLVGGFGISGDGVDQDDVVTFAGQEGFAPPQNRRADMLFYRGVRLPFQKFNRNPRG